MGIEILLPETPPKGLLEKVLRDYEDNDLGGNFCLYRRESILTNRAEWKAMMTPDDIEDMYQTEERHWGAVCTCTNCGEDFDAGYYPNGIIVYTGPDGMTYPGWCTEDTEEAIPYMNGEQIQCPCCDALITVKRKSEFKHGRTNQLMVCTPQRAGNHMALVYWMVYRRLDAGCETFFSSIEPWEAIVITERGKLQRYLHQHFGPFAASPLPHWLKASKEKDPEERVYHDYDSICQRKKGAVVYAGTDSMEGTTGEKTGLMQYMASAGEAPYKYLKVWQRFHAIENLVKDGWTPVLDSVMGRASYNGYMSAEVLLKCLDTKERKPHRILHMTKDEYKTTTKSRMEADLTLWAMCWKIGKETCSYSEFREAYFALGATAERLIEKTNQNIPHYTIKEVMNYCKRKRHGNLPKKFITEQLIDYRRMMEQLNLPMDTEETLWPAVIVQAHDRVADMVKAKERAANQVDFDAVREKLRALEWTDGELCIRIPKSEGELIEEGSILRHCVGSYGKEHAKGQRVILFVRHHRRPERSYYTLNEDITAEHLHRIQLHGYGNERHGDNKQYSHSIPDKVKVFVDRWERDVLAPWLIRQAKAKETA